MISDDNIEECSNFLNKIDTIPRVDLLTDVILYFSEMTFTKKLDGLKNISDIHEFIIKTVHEFDALKILFYIIIDRHLNEIKYLISMIHNQIALHLEFI